MAFGLMDFAGAILKGVMASNGKDTDFMRLPPGSRGGDSYSTRSMADSMANHLNTKRGFKGVKPFEIK
jgi:hypothetical protein